MARPISRSLVVLVFLLAAVHTGLPVRAAEPSTLSSARLGLAQLDHRLADLQARTGAQVEALNMRQGRALIAEQWLYSARETARASGFLVRNSEARRLLMTSPPPQVVTYSRALIRYHRLLHNHSYTRTRAAVDRAQGQIAAMANRRMQLAALIHRLSSGHSGAGSQTFEGWARLVLSALGAPTCGDNRLVMVAWEAQESTAARFNPLATTHTMTGATNFNSVGVKNYVSAAQGVQATVETLTGGATSYGYGAILASLRACGGAAATARAVNDSAWCRGCTGGAYLTGLLPVVEAGYTSYASRPL